MILSNANPASGSAWLTSLVRLRSIFLRLSAERLLPPHPCSFDQQPQTRLERAERVKKRNVFAKYGEKARAVLDALLDKYADSGLKSVESLDILRVDPLTAFGTPVEIIRMFGDRAAYLAAIRDLETALYEKAA